METQSGIPGLTIRDWFAGMALQGEMAAQDQESGFYTNYSILANKAYQIADAMLIERIKG